MSHRSLTNALASDRHNGWRAKIFLPWFIAKRFLLSKHVAFAINLTNIIAFLGVTIGIMALLVVISVMSGFETELKNQLETFKPHLSVFLGTPVKSSEWNLRIQLIQKKFAQSSSLLVLDMVLHAEGQISVAEVKGIDRHWPVLGQLNHSLVSGLPILDPRASEQPGSKAFFPPIWMGAELATQLGVAVGDRIKVLSPLGKKAGLNNEPLNADFNVAGIFKTGFYDWDLNGVILRLQDLQTYFALPDKINQIEVRLPVLEAEGDLSAPTHHLKEILGPEGLAVSEILNWQQENSELFFSLRLEHYAMWTALILVLIVAAINIMISLSMTVLQKFPFIGIMMTMGATSQTLSRVFVLEGLMIGGTGTILGVFFTLMIYSLNQVFRWKLPDVYYATRLPMNLRWEFILVAVLVSMSGTLLATLIPVRLGAKLKPIDVIKMH